MGVGNFYRKVSLFRHRARGVPGFVMNGCGKFHRRVSLFRHRGKRGSVFRNEWVWEFFTEGFPFLVILRRGYQFCN